MKSTRYFYKTKNTASLISLPEAVRNEDIYQILSLLNGNTDVNRTEDDLSGNTSLHIATVLGNVKIMKLLLDAGADVNMENKWGLSALGCAIEKCCKPQVVKVLIDAGANIDVTNDSGQSALYLATIVSDVKMMEYLLSRGADVNIKDISYGQTPLHIAVILNESNSYQKTIEVLLKNGADVNVPDRLGTTPFHKLVEKADFQTIEEFILNYKADVNVKKNCGEIPLFKAIERNSVEIVQLLVRHGSDVNNTNTQNSSTLLHEACKNYGNDSSEYCKTFNTNIIKCLLKNGANINAFDVSKSTPLTCLIKSPRYSLEKDQFENTLRYLLKYVDFNIGENNVLNKISDFSWIWKMILKHVAICKVLDIPLHESVLDTILKHDKYNNYFEQCLKELSVAKNTKIRNCWITFFNILIDNERKLKNYGGNKELVKEFKFSSWKFLIYGATMRKRLDKGVRHRKLYDSSSQMFCRCLPIFKPSHLIVRDIFDCVPRKDL